MTLLLFVARAVRSGSPGSGFVPAARCVFGTCRSPETYWRATRPFTSKPVIPHERTKGQALASAAVMADAALSSSSQVVRVSEDLKKPARDDRSYRMVWLQNGMQIMLASDPSTDMAAASMNIHVGHFQDPEEFPGLAHFHEHMVFLGTDRYPVEGQYEAFLNEHGGASNAYTAMEDTNYYFSVKWDHLHGALDRFSSFFICPRFDNSSVDREVKAVDSEFYNNLQDDGWRLYQLQKSLADPRHPFSKFGSGNAQTLPAVSSAGTEIRDALVKFHETYYSANIMKLAVIGREPLDTLQSWVVPLFSSVRNTHQPTHFMPPVPAFPPKVLGTRLSVVPVKEMRRLTLAFPLPIDWEQQRDMQGSKPARYLSYLVGHEGKGSLYSLFNSMGWIDSLSAGSSMRMADMEVFKVSVSLTKAGAQHVDEIIDLVFQYLKLMRTSPVSRELFTEMASMSEIKFLFREKENAVDFASGVSSLMQEYPASSLFWGPYSLTLDEAAIARYAEQLQPSNLQITLVDSALEAEATAHPSEWSKEAWYGTMHKLEPLPESVKQQWANPATLHPALHLPPPNDFIPRDFSLRCDSPPYCELPPEPTGHPAPPNLIKSGQGLQMYHKLDRRFKVPKSVFFAHLISPQVYSSPVAVIHHRLYNLLLRDELNEFSYDASVAGLSYSVTSRTTGLVVKVSGFSHKLPVLLEKVVSRTQSLLDEVKDKGSDDPEILARFERQRQSLLREYTNFDLDAPYELAMYYVRQMLDGHCWHLHQYISVLNSPEECSPARMAETVAEGMSRMDVDVLAYGNLDQDEAEELVDTMSSSLKTRPLFNGEVPDERTMELQPGQTVVYQMKGPNAEEENSAVEVHLQVGSVHGRDVRPSVMMDMISHMASTSAYQRLRTEEQLGYIVFSFTRRMNAVQGFSVVVQSPKADPVELDERIEAWMASFRQELEAMTDEDLQKHVRAVIAQKTEKDKRLSEEAYRHWAEIVERRLDFDRELREVSALESLSKEDLLAFWDTHLAHGASERRKLSVYVFGTKHQGTMLSGGDGKVKLLETMEEIRSFKRTLPQYPAAMCRL